MSKRRAAAEEPIERDGAAESPDQPAPSREATNASSRVKSKRSGSDHTGTSSSKNGAIVVTVLLTVAALTAAYWALTGSTRTRAPPANAVLREVAQRLLHPSKGILAADESPGTFAKRLAQGVPNTLAARRQWRRTALTAPGLEDYISGVILHEESFIHGEADLRAAAARGLALGIKLDSGTVPLQPKKAGERATQGLQGLAERCGRFRERGGAVFAKWRAVFRVGRHTPSKATIRRNAADLAAYAAAVQRCGLLPILEPEVLAEGDHDLGRAAAATARVLRGVFRALRHEPDVDPGAVLLKVAFVTPGLQAAEQAEPGQVANATLRVLARTVPRVVPGIVFLSGGHNETTATAYLLAVNQMAQQRVQAGKPPMPWALSFSFGRALQGSALEAWQLGDPAEAQQRLVARARANALAQQGKPQQGEGPGSRRAVGLQSGAAAVGAESPTSSLQEASEQEASGGQSAGAGAGG